MGTTLQSISGVYSSDEVIQDLIEHAKAAQAELQSWTQSRVDEAVAAIGWYAYEENAARRLSQVAVDETGMGNIEDHFSRHRKRILGTLRDLAGVQTLGVISDDPERRIQKIAKPIGLIGAITPATAPTAAVVALALSIVKTRNAAIFCPNPAAKLAVRETVQILQNALRVVSAPESLLQAVTDPTRERLSTLMTEVDLIVASGGRGTVRRAYTSGTPAYGAGAGNAVIVIDETADVADAARKIVAGKSFDYGTSCSAESCIVIAERVWDQFLDQIKALGTYICDPSEVTRLRDAVWPNGRDLNRRVVGKSPFEIGRLAEIEVPELARAIGIIRNKFEADDPFGGEKLSPVLSLWKYLDFDDAIDLVSCLISFNGLGHSCGIYSTEKFRIDRLAQEVKVSRVMVNQSTGSGNTGSFDNGMPFTVVLSCGTWGGSTTTDNITWRHLLNYTWVSHIIPEREPTPDEFFSEHWKSFGR